MGWQKEKQKPSMRMIARQAGQNLDKNIIEFAFKMCCFFFARGSTSTCIVNAKKSKGTAPRTSLEVLARKFQFFPIDFVNFLLVELLILLRIMLIGFKPRQNAAEGAKDITKSCIM
jgi:hypothetical protein